MDRPRPLLDDQHLVPSQVLVDDVGDLAGDQDLPGGDRRQRHLGPAADIRTT